MTLLPDGFAIGALPDEVAVECSTGGRHSGWKPVRQYLLANPGAPISRTYLQQLGENNPAPSMASPKAERASNRNHFAGSPSQGGTVPEIDTTWGIGVHSERTAG